MKALATLANINYDPRRRALFSLLGAYYADDVCQGREGAQRGEGTVITQTQTELLHALIPDDIQEDQNFTMRFYRASITGNHQKFKNNIPSEAGMIARIAPWAFVLRNQTSKMLWDFIADDSSGDFSEEKTGATSDQDRMNLMRHAHVYASVLKAMINFVPYKDILATLI